MKRGLEVPKVQDILTKKVIAFRPDFSTLDAIKGFNQFRISSAPVVNESNEVVGFLSEGDSIKCLGNCLFKLFPRYFISVDFDCKRKSVDSNALLYPTALNLCRFKSSCIEGGRGENNTSSEK